MIDGYYFSYNTALLFRNIVRSNTQIRHFSSITTKGIYTVLGHLPWEFRSTKCHCLLYHVQILQCSFLFILSPPDESVEGHYLMEDEISGININLRLKSV